MSIVYVNSTVRARQAMREDGRISPIHYWGYEPRAGDAALAHRLNRVEITLRAKLKGLDPDVFLRTCWHLARGARGVYLVTQPDLWRALPLLRRLFPTRRLVTWAWMDWEVDRHFSSLRACDHVLCLTQSAKRRFDERGEAARASLAIWGCSPAAYQIAQPVRADTDVLIAGLVSRDAALARAAIDTKRYSVLVTESSFRAFGFDQTPVAGIQSVRMGTEETSIAVYRRCRVAWIPLLADDCYPSGYTNLIEALMCGTAVVIGDTSTIPEAVLALPGVFRYRVGSLDDFMRRTDEALALLRQDGAREQIAAAAARLLDGAALARTIREQMGLENDTR